MRRIPAEDLEQRSEAWHENRNGSIGGSDAPNIKAATRGAYKGLYEGSAGFWDKLIAEHMAIPADGEKDMDRGNRLEPENLKRTNELFGLKLVAGGMWLHKSKGIHVSPDGEEDINKPTYAFEGKAFLAKYHLRYIYEDLKAKEKDDYEPLYSVPKEYQEQVIQLFMVNKHLETVYFGMINEMVADERLEHYVIIIDRNETVENVAQVQEETQVAAHEKAKEIRQYILENI